MNRANSDDTGIDTTSAVGCFPSGASLYGVLDLSGNVWEWCATKWQRSYQDYRDDNDLAGDDHRVVRGGTFHRKGEYARCTYRYRGSPHYFGNDDGFRVVLAPIGSASSEDDVSETGIAGVVYA